ncbi:hypothetical protein AURDEDRAFT_172861 [Auricularia subglabra TFB-10046 SS5]|uniref:DUF6533 domain-containing protein n=1 Tax=Auricularia subglabra (strain TFB-10046 / SS5) TaxID=717982 RepID=J0D0Z6_AURST|nr:hypothetical protein AURDEDRAFT_172861 [Auricularia subglabra TFB-10046 SS5]
MAYTQFVLWLSLCVSGVGRAGAAEPYSISSTKPLRIRIPFPRAGSYSCALRRTSRVRQAPINRTRVSMKFQTSSTSRASGSSDGARQTSCREGYGSSERPRRSRSSAEDPNPHPRDSRSLKQMDDVGADPSQPLAAAAAAVTADDKTRIGLNTRSHCVLDRCPAQDSESCTPCSSLYAPHQTHHHGAPASQPGKAVSCIAWRPIMHRQLDMPPAPCDGFGSFLAARLRVGRANRAIDVAAAALFVYDHCSTLSDELALVWRSRWGAGTVLFLLARYPMWPELIVVVYNDLLNEPGTGCARNYAYTSSSLLFGITVAETILILRTWAIWSNRRSVLVALATLLVVSTGLNVFVVVSVSRESVVEPLDVPLWGYTCSMFPGNASLGLLWAAVAAFELGTFIVIMTVIQGIKHWRQGASHIIRALYRDSLLYFICIFSVSAVTLVSISTRTGRSEYPVVLGQLQRTLHSILTCRLMLHLRAVAHVSEEALHAPNSKAATTTQRTPMSRSIAVKGHECRPSDFTMDGSSRSSGNTERM